MTKRRDLQRILCVAALLAALLLIAWWLTASERSLQERASVRISLHGRYFVGWLTSSTALVIQVEHAAGIKFVSGTPVLLDVRSGRESPLTGLEALWKRDRSNSAGMSEIHGTLSMDGRLMLIHVVFRSQAILAGRRVGSYIPVQRFYLCDVNTRSIRQLPVYGYDDAYWLPTSTEILFYGEVPVPPWDSGARYPIALFSTDGARPLRRSFWTGKSSVSVPLGCTANGSFVTAIDSGQRFIYGSSPPGRRKTVPLEYLLTQYEPGGNLRARRQTAVPYPPGMRPVHAPEMSWRRDRLLWFCTPLAAQGIPRWLAILQGRLIGRVAQQESVWTSEFDGSRMRKLGATMRHGPNDRPAAHLQWLPDGASVSFVSGDTLYVAPAR